MGELRNIHPADCGRTFRHNPHLYETRRNKIKACDGSITKRSTTNGNT